MTDKMYCLNLSSNSRIMNYIYLRNVQESKISWNNASCMCQYMGGFLPIIRSKSELDEFISLISFSQYILPQDEFFISLTTRISYV